MQLARSGMGIPGAGFVNNAIFTMSTMMKSSSTVEDHQSIRDRSVITASPDTDSGRIKTGRGRSRKAWSKETREWLDREKQEREKLQQLVNEMQKAANEMQQDNDVLRRHLNEKDVQCHQLKGELEASRNESSHIKEVYEQMHQLLEVRTTELKGAQSFLGAEDRISPGEVKTMVESLNSEVYHIATVMAESLTFGADTNVLTPEQVATARKTVVQVLGPGMDALRTHLCHDDRPFLAQMAIQAFLVHWCEMELLKWHHEDRVSYELLRAYSKIQDAELPAVSGRWRSMTRANLKDSRYGEPRLLHEATNLLVVIGWTPQTVQEAQDIHDNLTNRFKPMIKLVHSLDKAIGESVTSSDLRVFTTKQGLEFNAEHMEESYEDKVARHESESPGHVVCTTDLGLYSVVRGEAPDGSWTERKTKILLKPKVILDTSWKKAEEPK